MAQDGMKMEDMCAEYEVLGFGYGYCLVTRKSDGVRGTLEFSHGTPSDPRKYYNFQEA